jgi:lactam utilization protein B
MHIDLNSDMGESFGPWTMGDDAAMLDIVTSANVACGFHAGDPQIMFRTAALALAKGVAIGAHPGFDDVLGFGRRVIRAIRRPRSSARSPIRLAHSRPWRRWRATGSPTSRPMAR